MQLIHQILSARNLTDACKEVIRNKGAAGVDKMSVKQLETYLNNNRERLADEICSGNYHAPAIRGKEIPKSNGKKRLLGIPTVIDRMLQQAVARQLMNHYEFMFYSQLLFLKVFMSSQPKAARFRVQLWIQTPTQPTSGRWKIIALYQLRLSIHSRDRPERIFR